MPSIQVLPAYGTAPTNIALYTLASGVAVSAHVAVGQDRAVIAPATDASAEAFLAAVLALSAALMPRSPPPQSGPFFFGFG